MSELPSPADTYRQRLDRFSSEQARWTARSRRLSLLRLTVFLAALAAALAALFGPSSGTVRWLAVTAVLAAVFTALVVVHDRVIRREKRLGALAGLNREGLARLALDWSALPEHGPVRLEPEPPLARDLHLFGHASLFHLTGAHRTPPGRTTLAAWMLEPASPDAVRRRQEAVAELAPKIDLRQELDRRAGRLAGEDPDVEPFLAWAEGEPWLLPRRGLQALTFVLPAVALGGFVAFGLGAVPFSLALLPLVVNFAVSHLLGGPMHLIFDRVSSRESKFHHYAALFEVLESQDLQGPLLRRRREDLSRSGLSAHRQMEILHQRVVLSDSRHSAPLNFILQALLLWDFHVLRLLERWQVRAGREARRWLAVLGEAEALAALATLVHDNPGWAFPEIVEEGPARLRALALAHPLLPPQARVANDVELGPPGTFLLVTGSNMSGKSTLLRALGVNAVLAQAGGPVCAASLTLPPLALGTSILIEDSLESGISFFMAELLRLREIVEAARRWRREGRTLLYLLDEVLRGTNSRERRQAAHSILHHLLEAGAVGAVSTHDPALLESDELAAAARPVYFRETFHPGSEGERVMTFDYRLREGVSPGGNAMKLLELVGLAGDRSGEEGKRLEGK